MKSITLLFILLTLVTHSWARGPSSPKELESFFDGFLSAQLLSRCIPGATIAVVRGGEVLLCKGYGVANLRTGQPVRGHRTLFRIASVSKPIVFTAVMQLVEKGELGLHNDVNHYLKEFRIPHSFGKAVTLAHLLTHTPGFEDTYFRKWSQNMKQLPSLAHYLAINRPICVRSPGETFGYSNYGASLAGHLIELQSKQTYEEYLKENIFNPLGMANTTARQPLPTKLKKYMSASYRYGRRVNFELILDRPAGAISSTAADMARFMMAHLGWGPANRPPILSDDGFAAMHQRQFGHHPLLAGHTFGFAYEEINGERIVSHTGAMVAFRSLMLLLPDMEVGLFVAYNDAAGSDGHQELKSVFLDRYFPEQKKEKKRKVFLRSAGANQGLEGWYRSTRFSFSSAAKISGLFGAARPLRISGSDLRFLGARWRPLATDVYEETTATSHPRRLAFRREPNTTPKYVFVGRKAYERLSWYESPPIQWAILLGCHFLFFSYLMVTFIGLFKKNSSKRSPYLPIRYRWSKITLFTLSLINILAGLFFFLLLLRGIKDPTRIFYGLPWWVIIPSGMTIVSTLLTPLAIIIVAWAWHKGEDSTLSKVYDSLVALAALVFICWLQYWNLLGFKY